VSWIAVNTASDEEAPLIRDRVAALLKPPLRPFLARRENVRLQHVPAIQADASALGHTDEQALAAMFASALHDPEWEVLARQTAALGFTDHVGAVNPGDRRAIFALARWLRVTSVLEIGTHLGASTVHIAAALHATSVAEGRPGEFDVTTVDIIDVNNQSTRRWARFGSAYSAAEMIRHMGYEASVEFVTRRSLDYMSTCARRYGLIFLDGDHHADTVYGEIPAALRLLEQGGHILLHDYFPNLRPLWAGSPPARGPWLAAERLRREGVPIRVIPLGALPWPTKRNSTVTSLALVTKTT
jgi:predicted O-methyltransferase YrrM